MYITAQVVVSEMTYTVSSGMLNSTIPYYTVLLLTHATETRRYTHAALQTRKKVHSMEMQICAAVPRRRRG